MHLRTASRRTVPNRKWPPSVQRVCREPAYASAVPVLCQCCAGAIVAGWDCPPLSACRSGRGHEGLRGALQPVKGKTLQSSSNNPRVAATRSSNARGEIIAADGTVLAKAVPGFPSWWCAAVETGTAQTTRRIHRPRTGVRFRPGQPPAGRPGRRGLGLSAVQRGTGHRVGLHRRDVAPGPRIGGAGLGTDLELGLRRSRRSATAGRLHGNGVGAPIPAAPDRRSG